MKQLFGMLVLCILAFSVLSGEISAQDDCYTRTEVDSIIAQRLDSALARYRLNITELQIPNSIIFCDSVIDLTDPQLRMRFELELLLFAEDQAQLLLYLHRGNRYFSVIDSILAQYDVTPDFRYCAVIESALRAKVGSNAGAQGWWQFRAPTGRAVGLVINKHINQRYDLIASTDAAARYIRDLKERFGDWFMAMAAYNWGRTKLAVAIDEQDTSAYFQLQMPSETKRYVVRAAAVKYAMDNPRLFGINLLQVEFWPPLESVDTAVVTVHHGLPVHYVVDWCSTTRAEIERLNPELIGDQWTPNPDGPQAYRIKIPAGTKAAFRAGLQSLIAGNKKK